MLRAFKEELKRLENDPNDDFHEKVKRRIGRKATEILEKRLKQIILLMPNLVGRIRIHWEKEGADPKIKKLGGFVFAYMYHPQDFLSKDEHGFFGYLDDAYLVASVYERVLQDVAGPNKDDQEYLATLAKTKKYVKAVIPDETKKIEEMVEGALQDGAYEKFAAAFKGVVRHSYGNKS